MSVSTAATVAQPNEDVSLNGRQRILLGLLDAVGGSMGNLDFQKVLFLYCQEPESGHPYDFVPYKRGAFSFTSYADRRKLIALGLIADDDQNWKFTIKGRNAVLADIRLSEFVKGLDGLRGDALIADTYRRFPYYAIRSEIAERILQGDSAALNRITAIKKIENARPLQTIGYEGKSLESYLNLLILSGVNVLCDVRRNPISRKYGFSKNTLANACAGVGIWYEHMPALGIASELRQELNTQDDYDALFVEYERDHLPNQTEALTNIQMWIEGGARVALTCYELHSYQCHRHCVSDKLEAMTQQRLKARHL